MKNRMKALKAYQKAQNNFDAHHYTKAGIKKCILAHQKDAWLAIDKELRLELRITRAAYLAAK